MKKRVVRLRWLVVLSIAGGLVLGGCEMVSKARGGVYDPRGLVPGLNDLTAGRVSPEVATLVATVGPAAIEAINALAEAWERSAAAQREADQREEEQRRLRTAEAQAFYADLCTHKAPVIEQPVAAPAPAASAGAKDSKDAGGLLGAKGALSALTGKDSGKDAKDAKDGTDGKGAPAIDPVATEKDAEAAYAAGDYTKAAGLLQQVYDLRKATLGDKHPEFARVANRLAVATLSSGDSFRAMALAMQGHEIRKQVADEAEKGKDFQKILNANLDVADSEAVLAQIYRSSSAYDLGRTSAQRALKIRTKHLGEQHACVAQSLNDLGELEFMSAHYAAALDLYRRAFSLRRQLLPADHRDLGQSLDNLGSIYKATGLYEQSKENYTHALESRRKLGESHPEVADSYHNLASLYRAMGDFASSEAYYEKALTIRRARPGFDLAVADTETAEAELYFSFGDFAKAEGLLDQAFQTRKKLLPTEHPDLAQSLADLARVEQAKGDLIKAEANQQQALVIWQKKLGADHPTVAGGLAAMGEILLGEGQFDRAELNMVKARAIREKRFGADHAETAASLQQLGELYYAKYDYAKAEPLLRGAIDVRKKKLGDSHPDLAASLSYLGALLVATNRADEAIPVFRQAEDISEQLLDAVGIVSSEARLDAVLRFLRAQDEVVYSLLDDSDAAPKAAPLVLSVALMRKGRSVDEAASISRTVYQSLEADDQETFSELRMLRAQIARQKLSGQASANPADTKKLLEQADKLEQDLAQRSARVRSEKNAPTLDDVNKKVAAALPASSSLIEVVEYRSYAFKAKAKEPRWGELHYAALVLDGKGAIQVAPLGSAEAIDAGVKDLLKTITDEGRPAKEAAAEAEVKKAGQALDAKVLDPVRPFLTGVKEIVLSPDGQLNLVPFWALYDGKTYLIDRYALSYVTSGRDLLARTGAASKHGNPPVLMAKPSFLKGNATYDEKTATRGLVLVEDTQATGALPVLAPRALRLKGPPSPLPGTEQEAKAIRQLMPRAKLFTGTEATKEKFLGLQAPGIVHVATHGFFLPSQEKAGGRGLESPAGLLTPEATTVRSSEPLLDSMLLWANVGRPVNGQVALEPGGLATALEVAGMNLWGTQLVVLSACDTGRGRVDDLGQGVYGLRRAMMVAGAETLVTSLWQVNDEVTRDLMVGYYKRLLAGAGRGEALRQASLAVRKKRPDPRDWAPFIAIGQMGPLKGMH